MSDDSIVVARELQVCIVAYALPAVCNASFDEAGIQTSLIVLHAVQLMECN